MVLVFGIDVPLVELIFVLTLVLFLLLGLLIYLVVNQVKLNKRLELILRKENLELKDLKRIKKGERTEVSLLRRILLGMTFRRTKKKLKEKKRLKTAD